ncbi:MAG: HD domain-containing protein [Flavobacteriaceae bacterium]|nr:HD domain-containing protein [Flavobacteriaceae bacterium]
MEKAEIIAKTMAYVREVLSGAESGHDWFHIQRVYNNALRISETEKVNSFVVALGALLHDIADSKFYHGDETIGPEMARIFLKKLEVEGTIIEQIEGIIRNISFKNTLATDNPASFDSPELRVIRDADRLDAIGAIGIARAFNYGGFKNRKMYDPDIPPTLNQSKEAYKNAASPTINHFYEKLLLLKDQMHTSTGKKMAEQRHHFMEKFLEEFYWEWNTNV